MEADPKTTSESASLKNTSFGSIRQANRFCDPKTSIFGSRNGAIRDGLRYDSSCTETTYRLPLEAQARQVKVEVVAGSARMYTGNGPIHGTSSCAVAACIGSYCDDAPSSELFRTDVQQR